MPMIVDQVKSALPLNDITVIDCHGHLGGWPLLSMPKNDVPAIVATMNRLGIDRLCLSHFLGIFCDFRRGNDIIGEVVRQYPDRLIGYTTINPHYPDEIVAELDRCRELYGMRSVKIHPFCHEYPADGRGYRELWQYADEKGMVVLTHTWESDKNCGPEMFGPITREYANVKIILAHAAGTQKGCDETINVLKRHHNLYLDIATSQFHIGMIERFVREVGAERVLFGSDIPLLSPGAALGRIAYAKIKEEDKENILGLNMKRLLGKE